MMMVILFFNLNENNNSVNFFWNAKQATIIIDIGIITMTNEPLNMKGIFNINQNNIEKKKYKK